MQALVWSNFKAAQRQQTGDRQLPKRAEIVDRAMLIRIPKAFKLGMSDLALYEANARCLEGRSSP